MHLSLSPPAAAGEEMLRCRACGEVIGVYEPLIVVAAGRVVESSRAIAPVFSDQDAEHYHRVCFERLGETQTPSS
jgi:hypothetical protein